MRRVLLLAAGGGHTSYAYALAEYLKDQCEIISVVPHGNELSIRKMEQFGLVRTLPLPRYPISSNIEFAIGTMKQSLALSSMDFHDMVVVSTGSSFCVLPSLKARMQGSKIINIESAVRLARPSKATKVLSSISDLDVLQWNEQKEFYRDGEVFGPLYASRKFESYNNGYILASSSTHGHNLLIDNLVKTELSNIVLQIGNYADIDFIISNHPEWTIYRFVYNFDVMIALSRIVITHVGDTILESALSYNKPTIVAFNPMWKRSATIEDARLLCKKLNICLLENITPDNLVESIHHSEHRMPIHYDSGVPKLGDTILDML